MKKLGFLLTAASMILASAISTSAMALPMAARSIIYFDAQNNIIGQQILYCNNVSSHAGNVSPSNPYRVEEEFGCGDRTITCKGDLKKAGSDNNLVYVFDCTLSQIGEPNYSDIVYFRSATGYTQSQYCQTPSLPNGAFAGHPTCGMPAPSQIPQFPYPYLNGWNP